MNNEQEIWKLIPSFPNYEASNLGNIRRKLNGRLVKQVGSDIRNYQVVSIYYNKNKFTKKVARLVWEAFNGCPCSQTIDHIDRIVTNNNIENLRCVSQKENSQNRTIYKQKNKYDLTLWDKQLIVKNYRSGVWSSWDIGKKYKVPSNYILTTMKRGTWDKLCNENIITDTKKSQGE